MTTSVLPALAARDAPSSVLALKRTVGGGSLADFIDLRIPASGLKLFGCRMFNNGRYHWVRLPGRPLVDRDKRAPTDANGKVNYSPTAAVDDKDTARRFSEAVIASLLTYTPGAFWPERFDGGGGQ